MRNELPRVQRGNTHEISEYYTLIYPHVADEDITIIGEQVSFRCHNISLIHIVLFLLIRIALPNKRSKKRHSGTFEVSANVDCWRILLKRNPNNVCFR